MRRRQFTGDRLNVMRAACTALLFIAGLATVSACRPAGEGHGVATQSPPVSADRGDAAATSGTGGSSADAAAVASQPLTAPDEPTADVLRAYVWECDGGVMLRMKNLVREGAVTLELHEGPRRLPQVASASGARYADETITFWTKGSEAILERKGAAPVTCREVRAQSLLADARERGVHYRGQGNEPGWTVEVGPGQRLSFVTAYGEERHEFASSTTIGTPDGEVAYTAGTGVERLEVRVVREACTDDMSGAAFDYQMRVAYGSQVLRGCAAKP